MLTDGFRPRTDLLEIALYVSIACALITLVAAGAITWTNATSRNLVLAWAALAGALMLFLLQLPFELR